MLKFEDSPGNNGETHLKRQANKITPKHRNISGDHGKDSDKYLGYKFLMILLKVLRSFH
jgi:hypothetical protein